MISDRRRLGLLALILLGLPPVAAAETTVELIARVKPSVVLVGSYGLLDSPRFGFSGTGFVVSDGRHVVTNAHVLPALPPGRVDRRVAIQHWSADAGWSVREASVKRTDPLRDLALRVVDGPPGPPVERAAAVGAGGAGGVLVGGVGGAPAPGDRARLAPPVGGAAADLGGQPARRPKAEHGRSPVGHPSLVLSIRSHRSLRGSSPRWTRVATAPMSRSSWM